MLHIRVLLFDFDGVLVDSEPLHFICIRAVSEKLLGFSFDRGFYDQQLIGFDDHDAFEWLRHDCQRPDVPLQSLLAAKEQLFCERLPEIELMPGAADFFSLAHAQFRCGIVSGALHSEITALVTHHRLPRPDFIVAAGDTDRGKPDPSPYRRGLELAHSVATKAGEPPLSAGHGLAFEDTGAGMKAALGAGLWLAAYGTQPLDPEISVHHHIQDWRSTTPTEVIAEIEFAIDHKRGKSP